MEKINSPINGIIHMIISVPFFGLTSSCCEPFTADIWHKHVHELVTNCVCILIYFLLNRQDTF